MIVDERLHFEQFEQLWGDLPRRFPKGMTYSQQLIREQHYTDYRCTVVQNLIALTRTVRISRVDLDGWVAFTHTEALSEIDFVLSKRPSKSKFTEERVMRFSFDQALTFLTEPIDPKLVVPVEMVRKAEEVNERWLMVNNAKVVPYLVSDEYGDDWKYKIVGLHYPDHVYAAHLPADTIDGVLYSAIVRAYVQGVTNGERNGILRAAEQAAKLAFAHTVKGSPLPQQHLPDEASNFMAFGFLPNPIKPLSR